MITPNMTPPPCFHDGLDCQSRYVGCKSWCKAWHEWLVIHEEEKAAIRQKKMTERTVDDFLAQTNLRKKQNTILECGKRYRERGRKA